MSLFQKTVVKKYTNSLNQLFLEEKWLLFTTIFHNTAKQQNIRNSKEEQYQAIFLNDLFVQVLGYTQHPNTNYNLITEQKNETNSKKADGAIILNENVHAVIELKGTETTDLSKIEIQAFGYKNNQKNCSYVIISNFEKLRFYIDNATEFVEFNLFTLSKSEFNLLFVCLSLESMQTDLPKKIKYESVSNEDKITKELYKDYSAFRKELFNDIVQFNPQHNKLELFKKTQKLLDRFLFIFFAEDRQLLPTNLIFSINLEWQKLREARIPISLYDRYKMYFQDLNTGARVTLPAFGKQTNEIVTAQYDIYAYNGGLFQPDDLLDNIAVNDDLLFKHTRKLSEYDFESEVDVNILGHIFENSLNEIDEMNAQIENVISIGLNPLEAIPFDKTKTKRKKDGVFYTPKYITKYIVDNTVGKLCEEKKIEIALDETKYFTDKKINIATKKNLIATLDDYRKWLLQLTIVDPACGSGAFLNQALEFLISEHKYVDELQAKLFGDALVLSDVEGSILENNLFGVDLNEESVEIAKLSLWLRTAQRNRKLNSLNNNIKCGNSIIDDVAIAGDKAFNWQNEFPKVFKEKYKKAYHLVFTTHNSRVSQRMIDFNVKKGPALELDLEQEIELTKIFKQIITENNLNCLAYNICKDHVHLVMVCEEEELTNIAKVLKGKSSYLYQFNGFKPIGESLWSQKFFFAQLDELIWSDVNPKPGYIATDTYLENAIAYIKTNRNKHQLPDSAELKNIIKQFVVSIDQAFETEYSGGFDVVIGNPPYGAKLDAETQNYLNKKYIKGGSETVISFTKLSYDTLLKNKGEFGFIIPKSFTFSSNYESIREYVFDDISEIIDCKKVWKEVLLEQIIFFFTKNYKIPTYKTGKLKGQDISIIGEINKDNFSEFGFYLNDISNEELNIALKIKKSNFYIKDVAKNSRGGIFQNKISEIGNLDVLGGAEVQRNGVVGIKGKIDIAQIENDAKCFINENSILVQNLVAHIENPKDHIKITACIPERKDFAIVDTINQLTFDKKYDAKVFWCLFNSKLINWYCYRFIFARAIRTMHFDNSITNRIPIPKDFNQQSFIEKADLMLTLSKEFQLLVQKFSKYFSGQFKIEKLSGKLEKWYGLSFEEFIKEINKAIKTQKGTPLSKKDEFDWIDLFEENKTKSNKLQSEIALTDKTIDAMVYELYGLSEEEIGIVEGK